MTACGNNVLATNCPRAPTVPVQAKFVRIAARAEAKYDASSAASGKSVLG
eukprot:CAMPEP_0204166424 /NCGR_PEP_ID=MMETSP0361-20130328/38980_1 /ASSEMBLY_ACC=CAM_ASM_000343 /TAXON_ID=268821 /ORGANISM="Scrippsiella Hangoei, Strain SHTV-5" /LENGTH=49 /DNA_ID= /DNA_START= /DNA_END= /DNA_ORIENTATION=